MRFDNLPDWLAWQETLHPRSIDLDLGRVAPVASRLGLGLVPAPFPIISVAGTNGKGSSVALLESISGRPDTVSAPIPRRTLRATTNGYASGDKRHRMPP